MNASLQVEFGDYEQVYAKKKTRRKLFLDEVEATIPRHDFLAWLWMSPENRRKAAIIGKRSASWRATPC